MRQFRLLEKDEIECRISEISKSGNGLSLLLYKTARTDAALLDETVGWQNWQNQFECIDGKMYCGIGIYSRHEDENWSEWVWKWDCGTESNTEAEKGQASDAFKRAGFKWGIGAELYSSPRIWISADKCEIKEVGGKFRCYDTFSVEKIAYDDKENISGLAIRNDKTGKRCFVWQKEKANAE